MSESHESAVLVRSPKDLVVVAIGPDGAALKLAISPQAMRLPPEDLAEEILAALRTGRELALERMAQRAEGLRLDTLAPSLDRVRQAAAHAQAQVARQAEQTRADLDEVRQRLERLGFGQ